MPEAPEATAAASFTHQAQLRWEQGTPLARGSPSTGLTAPTAASPIPSSSFSSSSNRSSPHHHVAAARDSDSSSEEDGEVRPGAARVLWPVRHQQAPQQAQIPPATPDDAPRSEGSSEGPDVPRALPGFLRQTASQTASRMIEAPSGHCILSAAPVPYFEPEATQRALLLAESITRSHPVVKAALGSKRQPSNGAWHRPDTSPVAAPAPRQREAVNAVAAPCRGVVTGPRHVVVDAPSRRSGLTSNGVPVSIAERYSCRYRAEEIDGSKLTV